VTRLLWLAAALGDLERIGDYLLARQPRAAARITARLVNAAESLAEFPGLGRPGRVIGTRELVVTRTPYLIVYRVREQTVEILAVLHAAQAWPDHFDPPA